MDESIQFFYKIIKAVSLPTAFLFYLGFVSLIIAASTPKSDVIYSDSELDEIFLSFRFTGISEAMVIGLYDYETDNVLLPVLALFSLLEINQRVEASGVTGFFVSENNRYRIDFNNRNVVVGERMVEFTIDEMGIDESDYYLHPRVFEEAFNLNFQIDFSNLNLRLQARVKLPIEERIERERRRSRMDRDISFDREYFQLLYPRKRQIFNAGFLDYNIDGTYTQSNSILNTSFTAGAEILGGDIQGNFFGNIRSDQATWRTSGLRWRYAIRDNPYISQIRVGQINTESLNARQIRGASITNNRIEPRRLLDNYVLEGMATPQAEVELYMNERLIEFQIVDDLGNYRFEVPLTYGSSRVRLVIYEPDGRIRELDRRVQVPFTFLPPGEFTYTAAGGQLENPILGSTTRGEAFTTDFAYGLTNWLTARFGGEYLTEFSDELPFYYTGISARILSSYLFTADAAPENWYRLTGNVIYSNSSSLGLNFTYFDSDNLLYNPFGAEYEIGGNIYTPFVVLGLPLGVRISANRLDYGNRSTTRLSTDLNARVGRVTLRVGYRDQIRVEDDVRLPSSGRITSSATYTVSRTPGIPTYLRGTFLRAQADYSAEENKFESAELQLSQSIFRNGRLRLSGGRNFFNSINFFEASFVYDFNQIRSSTTYRQNRNDYTIRQNLRGSVGLDSRNEKLLLENRQQVGRSAVAVRMFVDRNNTGTYDEGDELISANAVRLDRAGSTKLSSDGLLRITQLQPYYRYNLTVNEGAIPNPLWVPEISEFSFVTDPNQYKTIDIPFYMSGVIDGYVYRKVGERQTGLGGVRVIIRNKNTGERETLRTFSDGAYYAMEIRPGQYEAWVDTTQQDFLQVRSIPEVLEFEVRALADGDFVEGLDIILVPREQVEITEPEHTDEIPEVEIDETKEEVQEIKEEAEEQIPLDRINGTDCIYELQLGSFNSHEDALELKKTLTKEEEASIIFNATTNLYALRIGKFTSLHEAIMELNSISVNNIGIVTRCGENKNIELLTTDFVVQYGAFTSEDRAKKYVTVLFDEFGIDAQILFMSGSHNLFLVIEAGFESANEAYEYRLSLNERGFTSETNIRLNPNSEQRINFSLGIILAEVSTNLEADKFMEVCHSLENVQCEIFADSDRSYVRIISPNASWNQIVRLNNRLSNELGKGTYILLLEQ